MERKPEVAASNRDEALFHFVKPSGAPRGPSNSSVSLTSQRHLGSSLRSPVEVEGNECFPPQPKKDIESSFSTRHEARFPYPDLRAMTRSHLPRQWRPDFPVATREAT